MYKNFIAYRWHITALIILTLVWGVFWWRLWTPTEPDRIIFAQDGDFSLHYYAPISYQMERFAGGQLAQWNPYGRAGFPHIGNIQNSTFYLPRYMIAAAVPGAWTIETLQWEVAVHVWLTSVLMYAFVLYLLRKHPQRIPIALFGGLIWAYSGYITGYPILHVNILETVTWLPLALLGVRVALEQPRWMRGVAMGAASVALMALAGHPQVALYVVYLIAAYGLYTGWSQDMPWRKTLPIIAMICAGGGMLAAAQLLPTLELMRLSSRVAIQSFEDKAVGFNPGGLLDWLWPNGSAAWSPLYLGLIVLLLAAMSRFAGKRETIFWAAALAAGVFFTFGGNTIVYAVLYVIAPGVSMFRHQERGIVVAIFALVMLAVQGLGWLTAAPERKALQRFQYAAYAAGAVLALIYVASQFAHTLGAPLAPERLQILAFAALIACIFAAWASAQHFGAGAVALLAVLVCVDLLTAGSMSPNYVADQPQNRLQLDAPLQAYRTEMTQITWRVDGGAGLQGAGDFFRVPDIYGVGPFSLASVDALYTLPVDRFWEIFSVRYATITDPPPPNLDLALLAYGRNREGGEYQLIELLNPRPLAHLVYDYRFSHSSAEFARQIMADPNINLREQAITLYPLPFELPVTRPAVSRIDELIWESPERLTMRVSSSADALLTLSVVNYPGWRASVNGQPTEIVDVYAGLIGVPLRAGENLSVELYFQSRALSIGVAISLAAFAALVVALIATEWRAARRERV